MTHWDSSNDYSRQGLTNEYAISKNVPVYLNGVKVYGEEPPKLSPTPTPTIDPSQTPDANASSVYHTSAELRMVRKIL